MGPAGDKNVRSAVESGIQPGRGIDHVQTGLVQSHRVGGGQQAHVGHQGQVAPAHAVAVRGHVEHKVDVTDALAPALDRAVGVFGKAFHKGDHFCGPVQADGLDRADGHAFKAADAARFIQYAFFVVQAQGLLRTDLNAFAAADTGFGLHADVGGVLVALAAYGRAAHGQVFDGPAKARHFVPLEVREHNHGWRAADFRSNVYGFEVLGVDAHGHVVFAVQTVGQDDGRARHCGGEAVPVGRVEVVHGIVARAGIERGGIGKEGFGPGFQHFVHHLAHQGGVEVGVVAVFAKVQLDGGQIIFFQDFFQAQSVAEAGQLGQLAVLVGSGAGGRKIDCRGHIFSPRSLPLYSTACCALACASASHGFSAELRGGCALRAGRSKKQKAVRKPPHGGAQTVPRSGQDGRLKNAKPEGGGREKNLGWRRRAVSGARFLPGACFPAGWR